MVLATGVVDRDPDIPGLRETTLRGVIHWCPICNGYEATDRNVAVPATAPRAAGHTCFLRTYSRRVTLFTPDHEEDLTAAQLAELAAAGVRSIRDRIASITANDGLPVRIQMSPGAVFELDVLYPMLGCAPRAQLAPSCARPGGLPV